MQNIHKMKYQKILENTRKYYNITQSPYLFDLDILNAQKNLYQIQGLKNIWDCGSYFGYVFHEDGIQSAAHISNLLGVKLPWKRYENFINILQYL